MQAILDTALGRADSATKERFALLSGDAQDGRRSTVEPGSAERESWIDDLDRAVVSLNHQDFALTERVVNRWLIRYPVPTLGERGRYLQARSLSLIGAMRRDQGMLEGPGSAQAAFASARAIFATLDLPCRVAQTDLALAVLI
jgi:hypothetical protein